MKATIVISFIMLFCACSSNQSSTEMPSLNGPCGYATRAEMEEALGVSLSESPAEINEEYLGGRGCSFAGQKEDTEAHFGYITFPDASGFDSVKSGERVSGAGEEAYIINGPDAQQLWVREGDRFVMVAIGDVPRTEESKKLAALVLERLKTKPLN